MQKADADAKLAAGASAKVMESADQEQGLRDAFKVLDKGNGMVSSAEFNIVANLKVKTEKTATRWCTADRRRGARRGDGGDRPEEGGAD